jgi:dsDNA-specific endonuclease/ATPase MutS2
MRPKLAIFEDYLRKMSQNKTIKGRTTRVVDLHLKAGYRGSDAVERQLVRFRGELDSAIRAGATEIVFIHGVGSGVLKKELRNIILKDYPSCIYHDAPFNLYGVDGATLVTLKKS